MYLDDTPHNPYEHCKHYIAHRFPYRDSSLGDDCYKWVCKDGKRCIEEEPRNGWDSLNHGTHVAIGQI